MRSADPLPAFSASEQTEILQTCHPACIWDLTTASSACTRAAGLNGAPTIKRPLFLCPSSLVGNWGKELRKWVGEDLVDPVCCVDTSGPVRVLRCCRHLLWVLATCGLALLRSHSFECVLVRM